MLISPLQELLNLYLGNEFLSLKAHLLHYQREFLVKHHLLNQHEEKVATVIGQFLLFRKILMRLIQVEQAKLALRFFEGKIQDLMT